MKKKANLPMNNKTSLTSNDDMRTVMKYLKMLLSLSLISSYLLLAPQLLAVNFPPNDQLPANCEQAPGTNESWEVDFNESNAGLSSLRAAQIAGPFELAGIECTYDESFEAIEFAYKVSTGGSSFNGLYLKVNDAPGLGTRIANGETDWTTGVFPLTNGSPGESHRVRWSYVKLTSDSVGQDTAWIDSVIAKTKAFPASLPVAFPPPAGLPADYTITPANSWSIGGDDSPNDAGLETLRSADVGDNQTASIEITHEFIEETDVTFDIRVSSELIGIKGNDVGGDFLRFYINDELAVIPPPPEFPNAPGEKLEWSGEVDWEQVTFTVPAGTHTLRWSYEKDGDGIEGNDRAEVDNISLQNDKLTEFELPLNYTILPLNSQPSWAIDETDFSPVDAGNASVKTATVADNETAAIEAITEDFAIPTAVRFDIKVSSEVGGDFLRLYIDDVLLQEYEQSDGNGGFNSVTGPAQWSGELDWTTIRVTVPAGRHTLSWRYEKNPLLQAGDDSAWLDNVSLRTPSADITLVIEDVTVNEGELVTLDASQTIPGFRSLPSDLVYSWEVAPNYNLENLSGLDQAILTFTAPSDVPDTTRGTVFYFFLTVSDPATDPPVSKTTSVSVTVQSSDTTTGLDDLDDSVSGSLGIILLGGLLVLLLARRKIK